MPTYFTSSQTFVYFLYLAESMGFNCCGVQTNLVRTVFIIFNGFSMNKTQNRTQKNQRKFGEEI